MTVYLLGLDGASLDQVRSLANSKRLPSFEKVIENGVSAPLRSVYPYVTAPAWSSLFSGVNPGKHGLFDQLALRRGMATYPNIRRSDVPFLWDYVSKAEKRVLAVGIPFIHPAPKVNGVFVSGRFVRELTSFPPGLDGSFDLSGFDDLKYRSVRHRLHRSKNEKALKLRRMISDLRKRLKTSRELIDSDRWDMVAVVDGFPDEFLHVEPSNEDIELEMFRTVDSFLGFLTSRMERSDSLMIVSDHGFTYATRVLFMKQWLISRKYVTEDESTGRGFESRMEKGIARRIPAVKKMSSLVRRGLTKGTEGFDDVLPDERQEYLVGRPAPGSLVTTFGTQNLVWIRFLQESGPRGGDIGTELTEDLEELRRAGLVKGVYRASELYHGNHVAEAPGQLLVEPADDCVVDKDSVNVSKIYKEVKAKIGRHNRDGLFISYGSPRMLVENVVSIHDVLPTLLRMLELPIPDFLDGKPLSLSHRPDIHSSG